MKRIKMIGMALVAFVLCIGVSSCEKSDNSFIPVDYSKDLVGTWTYLGENYAEALVISANGSVLSTGVEDGEYWENIKGTVKVKNNKIDMKFEDEDNFSGRFEIIPGEALVLIDTKTDEHYTYRYCKKDLSQEIVGMWVCNDFIQTDKTTNMAIYTFKEDGKYVITGMLPEGGFVLNENGEYKVIGDLHIAEAYNKELDKTLYVPTRLTYSPDGTAYGDIMTIKSIVPISENEFEETSTSFLRIKQHLELPGQKYDYIKTYLTNASGLDKDFNVGGFTLNFSKLDGKLLDKMLKTLLFTVEFPDANTIKYSYTYNSETVSATAPIEVEGNKMTVRMDQSRGYFRDMDLYAFQDKDNTQMHIYMSKYAFINYFGNIAITLLEEKGEIDPSNKAAVDAVFDELTEIITTINVSFIMSKSK